MDQRTELEKLVEFHRTVLDDLAKAERERNAAREVIVRFASRLGVKSQEDWDAMYAASLEAIQRRDAEQHYATTELLRIRKELASVARRWRFNQEQGLGHRSRREIITQLLAEVEESLKPSPK